MILNNKRGSIRIPDKVIIDSIGSKIYYDNKNGAYTCIKDTEYSPEFNMPYLELSTTQIVNRTNIEDIIKENKNMNIEYNNKNKCCYIDIDIGEAFSVPNNYNMYIKIKDSYTSKDDGICFNAIELNTGARSRFPDSEKVLRYKNAKVVIDVEE